MERSVGSFWMAINVVTGGAIAGLFSIIVSGQLKPLRTIRVGHQPEPPFVFMLTKNLLTVGHGVNWVDGSPHTEHCIVFRS